MMWRLLPAFLLAMSLVARSSGAQDYVQLGSDIVGESEWDFSGHSVSLSSDGRILAIGAPGAGYVRIYSWDGSAWVQRGSKIDGEGAPGYGSRAGHSVSLSSDGNTLAIGGPGNIEHGLDTGHVRIYSWDGSAWVQVGNDIDGVIEFGEFGRAVSLSADGTVVAIRADNFVRVFQWDGSAWTQQGDSFDDGSGDDIPGSTVSLSSDGRTLGIGNPISEDATANRGRVRLYEWNDSEWVRLGSEIDGIAPGEMSGYSVSLSSSGVVIAVGAPSFNSFPSSAGRVRIYAWNGSEWMQRGTDIVGQDADDWFGSAVSLSSDGNILAVGAPGTLNSDSNFAGAVHMYEWDGESWIERGSIIDNNTPRYFGDAVSLSSDGSRLAVGAWSDNQVRIYERSEDVNSENIHDPRTPSSVALLQAFPNPSGGVVRIRIHLEKSDTVRLSVHDVLGRRVATLAERFFGPGAHEFKWNATDDSGAPMPSGIYIVRMDAAGQSVGRMVSLLR